MTRVDRRTTWRVLFTALLAGTTLLALMPSPTGGEWFEHADKLRHVLAFAVLGYAGLQARWLSAWPLALVLLGYGAAIELAQALTPTRTASLADLLADGCGIALALLGVRLVRSSRRRADASSREP